MVNYFVYLFILYNLLYIKNVLGFMFSIRNVKMKIYFLCFVFKKSLVFDF